MKKQNMKTSFWKNIFYNFSILVVAIVALAITIVQSLMSVFFSVQTKDVTQVMPLIYSKIIVFGISFGYMISVMLFLANKTKIARLLAILTIALQLCFYLFNMFALYKSTHEITHIVNMFMIFLGLIALGVYIKLNKN